jgi:hypothetical protein
MSRVDERTQVLPEASLNAGSKRRACEVGEKTLHCFLVADQVVVDEIYVAPVAKLVEPVELLEDFEEPRVVGGHSPVVSLRMPCGDRRRRLSLGTGPLGVLSACWVRAELQLSSCWQAHKLRTVFPCVPLSKSNLCERARQQWGLSMILGMSVGAFTILHVIITLVAIGSGLIVVGGMFASNRLPVTTALFLFTTALTSLTGFLFPIHGFTPALGVGMWLV